jgi:hypothetical protein
MLRISAGKRQDNRAKERSGSLHRRGYRFFADDEDEFELEDLLEAMCFLETGRTWVPNKPWEQDITSKWVDDMKKLPMGVQHRLQHLTALKTPAETLH